MNAHAKRFSKKRRSIKSAREPLRNRSKTASRRGRWSRSKPDQTSRPAVREVSRDGPPSNFSWANQVKLHQRWSNRPGRRKTGAPNTPLVKPLAVATGNKPPPPGVANSDVRRKFSGRPRAYSSPNRRKMAVRTPARPSTPTSRMPMTMAVITPPRIPREQLQRPIRRRNPRQHRSISRTIIKAMESRPDGDDSGCDSDPDPMPPIPPTPPPPATPPSRGPGRLRPHEALFARLTPPSSRTVTPMGRRQSTLYSEGELTQFSPSAYHSGTDSMPSEIPALELSPQHASARATPSPIPSSRTSTAARHDSSIGSLPRIAMTPPRITKPTRTPRSGHVSRSKPQCMSGETVHSDSPLSDGVSLASLLGHWPMSPRTPRRMILLGLDNLRQENLPALPDDDGMVSTFQSSFEPEPFIHNGTYEEEPPEEDNFLLHRYINSLTRAATGMDGSLAISPKGRRSWERINNNSHGIYGGHRTESESQDSIDAHKL